MSKKVSENKKVLLLLKNNKLNWANPSYQTRKMRNDINEKIRELGEKYYNVKNLFEKLNLKRDLIFEIGKELEVEYKNTKKGLHLQTQQRRMKESLFVWFTENFYSEIFSNNSTILNKLINKNPQMANIKNCNPQKNINSNFKNNETFLIDSNIIANEKQASSFYKDIVINNEIDNFDYSNIENDFKKEKSTDFTDNFNFGSLFLLK